jgi:uncharacterized integral membrane protein
VKNFLKFIILAPIAVLLLLFAFANRQVVAVSFDPFVGDATPAFQISAPLFLVLLLSLMIGVLVGGLATWFSQGRVRKAARRSRAEADRLRGEAQTLRGRLDAGAAPSLPRRA